MTPKFRFAVSTLNIPRLVGGGLLVVGVAVAAFNQLGVAGEHPRAGTDARRDGTPSLPALVIGGSRRPAESFQVKASASGEVDALGVIMRRWGVRRIAVCGARDVRASSTNGSGEYTARLGCAGSPDAITADARAIAAAHSQAVIFSGTAEDAATFVTALRDQRSFAMVVLAPSVDRDRVARLLPGDARKWVLAAGWRTSDGPDAAQTLTVAMLRNSDRHAR